MAKREELILRKCEVARQINAGISSGEIITEYVTRYGGTDRQAWSIFSDVKNNVDKYKEFEIPSERKNTKKNNAHEDPSIKKELAKYKQKKEKEAEKEQLAFEKKVIDTKIELVSVLTSDLKLKNKLLEKAAITIDTLLSTPLGQCFKAVDKDGNVVGVHQYSYAERSRDLGVALKFMQFVSTLSGLTEAQVQNEMHKFEVNLSIGKTENNLTQNLQI